MGEVNPYNTMNGRQTPYIQQVAKGHNLIVNGKPFLMLPAELHNSSFSCPEFMKNIWPVLKDSNVNTVLANVSWEDIEPAEGILDFKRLDQGIRDARQRGFRLVLLWFGAFKNGKSNYAPRWVKTDPARFPRMMLSSGTDVPQTTDVLSIIHDEVVKADSAAFKALMQHLRNVDSNHSTVLMVQVENEVGLLGGSRDVSADAEARFQAAVPAALIEMIRTGWSHLHESFKQNLQFFRQELPLLKVGSASWVEVFGATNATDELFMAYHYALYVERVAKAGKAEYELPLFTNVWQNYADEDADKTQPIVVGGGGQPGDYPSGGGVVNVLDVWHHFAPSLDFIAPDLYLNDYNAVCSKYRHTGQPLFIPEQRRDDYGARRIWSAYATYHALGASPFAIDSLNPQQNPWRRHFALLGHVASHLTAARKMNQDTFGFWFDKLDEGGKEGDRHIVRMGGWEVTVERSFVFGQPGPGFGLVIRLEESKFLLVGEGFQVSFASMRQGSSFTGFLSFLEKVHDPQTGVLVNGRTLNGDETRSGQLAIMPNQQPDPGTFPICITIPARSAIAEIEIYEF
ncbi:glycoside hydrolase superfamily [Boeremia exigua]|uniref:glycoside hydrolase superfamily n=1 Tax=Boeremia exigua TaxID=749465 RepID=UPI001E8D9D28|nr:glycoside hydrolase superfamily [Boeremia exigua]KAH6612993.1 glycoside hydrolase superfamily [Boeremia exigua]